MSHDNDSTQDTHDPSDPGTCPHPNPDPCHCCPDVPRPEDPCKYGKVELCGYIPKTKIMLDGPIWLQDMPGANCTQDVFHVIDCNIRREQITTEVTTVLNANPDAKFKQLVDLGHAGWLLVYTVPC